MRAPSLVASLLYRTQIRFASSSIDIADFIREMSSAKKQKTESSSSTQNKPRHVRMKERGRDPGLTSRINLQVISNGYAGTCKSVIINNDQTNYLFNCGEGTQRTLQEKNTAWEIKFSKTKHLFVTRKSWDTMGGLLGVCISLKDAYLNEITFHAPCDVISLLKHWKGLEAFPNVKLEQNDYDKGEFKDDCFKINAIPLRANSFVPNLDTKRQRLTTSNDLTQIQKFPDDLVYAYLCETYPFPGTLSAELCAFHGVPPTELRARLKNGEDVTLPDGRLIRSKDVTLPGEPPVKVLILDCPSLTYLDSISKSELNSHSYHVIVHLAPNSILNNEAYRTWMKSINTTHHLLLDETQKNVHMEAIYRYQTQLNYIDNGIFPLLSYQNILQEDLKFPTPVDNISYGFTSTRIPIRPTLGPDNSKLIVLQPQNYIDLLLANEEFQQTFTAAKQQLQAMHEIAKTGHSYPEIVFLGTGSACPSKPRNTSGILVHINDGNIFLLECAEGTIGQIRHFYGDQSDEILSHIRFTYISHMHADHLGGLYGLLRQRRRAFENLGHKYEKLILLCPNKYVDVGRKQWSYFSNEYSFDDDVHVVFNRTLTNGLPTITHVGGENTEEEIFRFDSFKSIGLHGVQTVLVEHIYDAHALVLRHIDGWSLAFSGDCKQSSDFIQAGQNVDVLIHEATFETGLEVYASQMRHCTMAQAIDVGRRMNAKYTILWHFSQRYAKIPFLSEAKNEDQSETDKKQEQQLDNVCISFDFMRFHLSDLPRACELVPIFESMFYDEWLSMKKKQTRRDQEPDYFTKNTRMMESKRKFMSGKTSTSSKNATPSKTTNSCDIASSHQ
ncbi:unnamed protein product [Rotaria socialis]|uniref:ribonuclease Z n=1 Tax=Rotaria socialis TaxID=392032 RepID=A0A818Z2Y8_9BILA|nr:unnamed protein product [Rotaria socialis]CAF4443884.1 unnamed protein product [Rotaria socialis]